tara:strand:- start:179 stop:337 length:159 start_codon:yes stop_codon:yes gene_type:complete
MAENKYFYQDGYSAQEEKKLKRNEEWVGKSLEEVKEGIANDSLMKTNTALFQ